MPKAKTETKGQTTSTGFNPDKVKVVKKVTLPIIKKVDDVPIYLTFTGAIFLGKQTTDTKGEKQEPAHLANCINLETGEEGQVICNTVLKSSLEENYPDESYVGKSFKILQMKVAGKRYKNYSIIEIEV